MTKDANSNDETDSDESVMTRLNQALDKYEVISLLGKGGMGAVYKAKQVTLDRTVAIKVLAPHLLGNDDDDFQSGSRFQREARAMAHLSHANIIAVYDFGATPSGEFYIVMEYIDGTDLHTLMRTGDLTTEHVNGWISQICEALQYAHGRGVVHRDIKPANIMITVEGEVKIADFGLAKLTGADHEEPSLTMTNVAMGTPDYIAPEALEASAEVDHRADLYAVGVMLYEMLTGKVPRGAWKSPTEIVDGLDDRYEDLVVKAMDTDPASRFQQATEIRSVVIDITTRPQATSPAELNLGSPSSSSNRLRFSEVSRFDEMPNAPKPRRKQSDSSAAVSVGIAAVLLLLLLGWWFFSKQSPTAEEVVVTLPPVVPTTNQSSSESDNISPKIEKDSEVTDMARSQPEMVPRKPEAAPQATVAKTSSTQPKPDVVPEAPRKEEIESTNQMSASSEPDTSPATASPFSDFDDLDARLKAYLRQRRSSVDALATQYLGGVDARINRAANGGQLKTLNAFRNEKKNVEEVQASLSETPGDLYMSIAMPISLPPLKESTPEDLVSLREIWTAEREKIRLDLDPKLDLSLQNLEAKLTRERDFERANALLAWRESLALGKARLADSELPTSFTAPFPELAVATKDRPFENSLGMKFVPVPGTEVLFGAHEVRYRDYARFAEETENEETAWKNQEQDRWSELENAPDHPVSAITWEEAVAFCEWLSLRDQFNYRLPTDSEWSHAIGIAGRETMVPGQYPSDFNRMRQDFPWGNQWPPPPETGNLYDETANEKAPLSGEPWLQGYADGFPTTAPVMSFPPNEYGIFDLVGNVSEWCLDWFEKEGANRTVRGSNYYWDNDPEALESSFRARWAPVSRFPRLGFRVVLTTPRNTPALMSGHPVKEDEKPSLDSPTPSEPTETPEPPAPEPLEPGSLQAYWQVDEDHAPLDISEAGSHTDFKSVSLLEWGQWAAVRENGSVVSSHPDFDRLRKVRKVLRGGYVLYENGTLEGVGLREMDRIRNVVEVKAGFKGGLALTESGEIIPFGELELSSEPLQMTPRAFGAIWNNGGVAIGEEGSLHQWGTHEALASISPQNPLEIVDIQGGWTGFLALRDNGRVEVWSGNPAPPNLPPFARIAASGEIYAGQKSDQHWVAWGTDFGGVADQINEIGPARDLSFEANANGFAYLIWIPANESE